MSKKTTQTPKAKRTRKTGKAALVDKLQRMNSALGVMLTPRFRSAGEAFAGAVRSAQQEVLVVSEFAKGLPDEWKPTVQRFRKATPESLKKMKAAAERLAERIAAAEAVVGVQP